MNIKIYNWISGYVLKRNTISSGFSLTTLPGLELSENPIVLGKTCKINLAQEGLKWYKALIFAHTKKILPKNIKILLANVYIWDCGPQLQGFVSL